MSSGGNWFNGRSLKRVLVRARSWSHIRNGWDGQSHSDGTNPRFTFRVGQRSAVGSNARKRLEGRLRLGLAQVFPVRVGALVAEVSEPPVRSRSNCMTPRNSF